MLISQIESQNVFTYTDNNPIYIVGNEITVNRPINDLSGTYTISPSFTNGLIINTENGEISGIPIEEYVGTYIITFSEASSSNLLIASVKITIYEEPSSLNYGIKEIKTYSPISYSLSPTTDHLISSYSINFEPSVDSQYYNINTTSGVINFFSFQTSNPVTMYILIYFRLNVIASNPAGSITISITINYINTDLTDGVIGSIYYGGTFLCGENLPDNYDWEWIYSEKWNTIEQINDERQSYEFWITHMPYSVNSWRFVFDGYFQIDNEGEYNFAIQIGYGDAILYIDGLQVLNTSSICNTSISESIIGSKQLTNGIHSIKIDGHMTEKSSTSSGGSYGRYRFSIKYALSGQTYTRIPFKSASQFNMLRGLEFDNHEVGIPINALTQIPFKMAEGVATECTSTPVLPTGLSFDLDNNIIQGSVSSESNEEYIISCSNENTVTNDWNIKITASNRYIKGLLASYMKSSDFSTSCSIPYTKSHFTVTTDIIRRENTIAYESDSFVIWNGLNENFANDYIVNWDGYFRAERGGDYVFNLTSYGGAWLYIDGELNIATTGCGEWHKITKLVSLSTKYYSIKVVYTKYRGPSGIYLTVQLPSTSEFVDPSPYLYTPYTSDLEYTYQTATYYVGKNIIDNDPIFPDTSYVISSTSIVPSIPPGLHFGGVTGKITGAPTSDSLINTKTRYTITINLTNGMTITTIIYITIKLVLSPEGFYLVDLNTGLPIDTNNVVLGEYYYLSIRSSTGNAIGYEVNNLPYNWNYNSNSGEIRAILSSTLSETPLTIVGIASDHTRKTENIYLTTTQTCPSGQSRVVISVTGLSRMNSIYVYLYNTNNIEVFYQYRYSSSGFDLPIYFSSICLPVARYVLRVRGSDKYITMNFNVNGETASAYNLYINDLLSRYDVNISIIIL